MLLPPQAILYLVGTVAVTAAVGGAIYGIRTAGYNACERDHHAAMVESIQRAQAQAREIALQDAEVSNAYETERERIRTVYRDREIEVEKNVPADCRTCSLSPTGLGLLNDALTNHQAREPNDPGQPDVTVPGTSNPPRWQFPGGGSDLGDRERKVL